MALICIPRRLIMLNYFLFNVFCCSCWYQLSIGITDCYFWFPLNNLCFYFLNGVFWQIQVLTPNVWSFLFYLVLMILCLRHLYLYLCYKINWGSFFFMFLEIVCCKRDVPSSLNIKKNSLVKLSEPGVFQWRIF